MTLEKLLNKLIEKGWKPMGHKPLTDEIKKKVKVERYNKKPMAIVIKNGRKYADDYYSLRDITSKESLLWQFVCENDMVKEDDGHITRIINLYKSDEAIVDGGWNCYYWLMICSTLDESELEEFLLDNIKIDE